MNNEEIAIGKLYQELLDEGRPEIKHGKYNLIDCSDLKIKTLGNKFVNLKFISKHFTNKDIIAISITFGLGFKIVHVTTDHTCMIYNNDHFFDNLKADQVRVGDYVSVYDTTTNTEYIGTVSNIENLGKISTEVYDFEVDDNLHCFYANDVLIHNSLFLNIKCVTDSFKTKYSLPDKIKLWPDAMKFELWYYMERFVTEEVTPNIRKMLQTECHCEDTSMMNYELEYVGDVGIYQAKKTYGVHKIVAEGPKLTNSVKYVGLEMRKATLPDAIKDTLKDVYENTFEQNWTEQDFRDYIFAAYDKFKLLPVKDIALWKGYGTAKASTGFLQIEKGATGISKACQYYNDLIKTLKSKKHHDEIMLNTKVRFTYLLSNNTYNINSIAFNDGDWPAEFNDLFQIDYTLMFDKCVLSPLRKFMLAAKYQAVNINQQMLFDIFDM